MTRFVMLVLLAAWVLPHQAWARPPAERVAMLARGVNITGWFRFPASADPAVLRGYMTDQAIAGLRRAGFSFVRLAVDPARLPDPGFAGAVGDAIRRLTATRLGVVVSLHPDGWQIERRDAERTALRRAWDRLAPLLRARGAMMVFPELLNEPVFPNDPTGWHDLQHALLVQVRAALPDHTIILTGHDWSSIAGLTALRPEADPNVVYTFHLYDPPELTSLAAYRAGLDRAALAGLPFPVADRAGCEAMAETVQDGETRGMMRYYCAMGWTEARVAARIDAAASWARVHDAVLLAGEFGASALLNPSARLNWLRLVRERCAAHGIGWALWGYDDVMGFALPRPVPRMPVLDRDLLRALGLVERVSGTDRS